MILNMINICLREISSILIILAFIKIMFKFRYGKLAACYMENQFGLWSSSCIVAVFILYTYYNIENRLKIDSLYLKGVFLVIFLGIGGVLIDKIYNLYFKSDISRYVPSDKEYLFIIFVSVIGASVKMISNGTIGIFEPVTLLLGRLIWLDIKKPKNIVEQIKIDSARIKETSILFLVGRCLISGYMHFFDGKDFIEIWGATFYGLILCFPYNFIVKKVYEKRF